MGLGIVGTHHVCGETQAARQKRHEQTVEVVVPWLVEVVELSTGRNFMTPFKN